MSIPHIKSHNNGKLLIVNDRPFIMLAGEVHNSNSSSVEYMEGVWDKAEKLGMNSLLMPVSWEMVEPEEGIFDFSLVDGLIEQARRRGKKLGLLWFGAWKNAQCLYAPAWVKTDLVRFKRAEVVKGQNLTRLENFHQMPYTTLSYLCEETLKADTRAFRELILHIKNIDEQENTVIIVQVENETGLQGSARENSDLADALFADAVPQDFADHMKNSTATMAQDVRDAVEAGAASGNWPAIFGDAAGEIFSAYYIACYVNHVAEAGKAVYPLPMAVNCWLDKGQPAGVFPSGGPVARQMEVWHYCAPAIDIIAPDIYVPDFCTVCDEYRKLGNPLFIPETATHSYAGPRQVYAVGHHHALGYAPFGFEEMGEPFSGIAGYLFGMDASDPALKTPQNIDEYGWYAQTLSEMVPLLTAKFGTSDLQAVICERPDDDTMIFGLFGFKAMMNLPILSRKDGVCLVLKNAEDEFYILANGCALHPFSTDTKRPNVDILLFEEGRFEQGQWRMIRRLNGDEAAMKIYNKPVLLKIKTFAYA
ncbi:MAG TPA: hypothetical protein DCM45_05690 [Clostridiales bacterium]|nr:hypothetical protein [Clostridiales bacterium]